MAVDGTVSLPHVAIGQSVIVAFPNHTRLLFKLIFIFHEMSNLGKYFFCQEDFSSPQIIQLYSLELM